MGVYTNSSGSNAVGSGFTQGSVDCTLSSVGGNAALNGTNPIHIVGIAGSCAGNGAARTMTMHYAGVSSSAFGVGSAGAAAATGWIGISVYLTGATSADFGYTGSGSFYFGRSSTSGAKNITGSFGTFTGVLGMSYEYYQSPTAPLSLAVMRATTTTANLSWTAPADDGGPGLTGYNIQASTSSDFSTGLIATTAAAGATSATVTGLTSNASYYFRIAARNEVTDNYSTSSLWSTVVNMPQVILFPKVWNGTAWVRPQDWLVWNGTQWAVPSAVLVWNGTAWVNSA